MTKIEPIKTIVSEIAVQDVCEKFFETRYYKDDMWRKDLGFKNAFECYLNEDVRCSYDCWNECYEYLINTYMGIRISFLTEELKLVEGLVRSYSANQSQLKGEN